MAATVVRYLRSVGSLPSAAAEPGAEPVEALPRPDLRAVGEDERAPVSPAEFRAVLGNFASGVTIITSPPGEGEDGPAGFACQSFASLSLDPPLVTFMVARTSTTWPRIARTGVFCVNILGAEQGDLCRAFAVSGADKFAGVAHTPAPATGSPQLDAVPAWIDCRIHAVHTGGDHLIVVGKVEAMGAAGEGDPLLFHKGRFGRFTD
ncbi:flavin reductase family protein [Streptomyces sp. NPDC002812]|uniref:flavin reductase family protein n=1 Tax=unclassified Streptomyces TaxID=2593676 RepID=UPI00202EE18A|nr:MULTISPECIES: flavin reductase family protein [unclassified Streptomyces]MCM1969122.1 flavin reductase family protein [Streptomyces sp. G1]MCX5297705.1 flavin reductase family protein [Streptomyces sp. NBC_00193]